MAPYSNIAALGSSYASGPGIDPVDDRTVGRSARNYPHQLAQRFGAALTDLTVSGATTATILDAPQRVLFTKIAPQINGRPTNADLVTITAGGNDLGYIAAALKLGVVATADKYTRGSASRLLRPSLPQTTSDQIALAQAGLARIVREVRDRAPGARVVLVDYLPLLGDATRPGVDVPFDAQTIAALRTVADELAAVFRDAAAETAADLVSASELGRGHELGSSDPWVQPLYPVYRLTGSFHPTAAGMQAVADAVADHVSSPAQ
ncbi:SGNH hydrolase-type esterase domain-containing protein OS=Tsukamurella paurometabola (strain ATCC 8368 / DSM / CCUG 35730 / CIP 100753 / JCM 10117 / KCTC 9821 / NBRC 16120 / NCIMB 702349 / NCTC 13040) OX=521096 GN=Tpau_4280 PE=4 SV=1 [Tsukamurella paurometabola]|uniref:SGNH hydrolase-type esterase domain-containing protein n=1 Tax=Tsukamurella paurometabola (strain ATCC 8368 / DSM 20162 / CCUG 35730 / CIP 100753 / JCM 10117 / KCTC 9821 / NBRC 16120 / NCIMB 702349 / NCTC 13040) TaxID=521096 RepID=D5UYZ9_TSUPD|nr:SGNH/GDSL hydrolase family protein [Tsukamurella paurometabola]ADG80846.1 conserved hypothetical protein [Tsukamurella paurometabola DSM 20162]SUQ39204.1 Lipase 2 precursor [Tsukamurella paurometabola]